MLLIAKPFAIFWLGLNILHKERLPRNGPAIIVANHNSHLDTFVMMCLFRIKLLHKLRPVAAADYFLKGGFISWISLNIIGILPITRDRQKRDQDPLEGCYKALNDNEILIIFPEGSRGAPEEMSDFKNGVARIAKKYPSVPVIPVYMQGTGRALPKGHHIIVPFVCTVVIGQPIPYEGNRPEFMADLRGAVDALKTQAPPLRWEEDSENNPSETSD